MIWPAPICQTPGHPYAPGDEIDTGGGEIDLWTLRTGPGVRLVHTAGEQFGVKGMLQARLGGSKATKSEEGIVHSIVEYVRASEREVESLTARDFLDEAQYVFGDFGVSEVLVVMLGGKAVYTIGPSPARNINNLSEVFRRVLFSLINSGRVVDEVYLETYGETEEFNLQVTWRFKSIHEPSAPAMLLGLFALPRTLRRKDEETQFFYEDRVNNLLLDAGFLRSIEIESRGQMEDLLEKWKVALKKRFDIMDLQSDVRVDFSAILV